MPYSDPLHWLEFPLVNSLSTSWILKYYPQAFLLVVHLNEIIASVLFYQLVYLSSKAFIGPWLVPSRIYRKLTPQEKIDFHSRVVSFVQTLLILYLIWPLFHDPELSKDRINGYTPYSGFVSAMASGYFIWDTMLSIRFYSVFGLPFVVHGLVSASVFLISFQPFILYYSPIFLLFELSTPFLNIHWCLEFFSSKWAALNKDEKQEEAIFFESKLKPLKLVNGFVFMVTFFLVRIVWGLTNSYWLFKDFIQFRSQVHWPFALVIILGNSVMNCLNLYWFGKMIMAVRSQKL